jgi:toxin ParE1/3/4
VSLRILKHRKFKRDALEVFVYIGEDNLDAAERFLTALNEDIRKLADMPGMGAKREFVDPHLSNIRSLPVTGFRNYLLFYRFDETQLQVLRVIHGARDIERTLSE